MSEKQWTADELRAQVEAWDTTLAAMQASPSRQEDRDQFLRTMQAFTSASGTVNSNVADKLRCLLDENARLTRELDRCRNMQLEFEAWAGELLMGRPNSLMRHDFAIQRIRAILKGGE